MSHKLLLICPIPTFRNRVKGLAGKLGLPEIEVKGNMIEAEDCLRETSPVTLAVYHSPPELDAFRIAEEIASLNIPLSLIFILLPDGAEASRELRLTQPSVVLPVSTDPQELAILFEGLGQIGEAFRQQVRAGKEVETSKARAEEAARLFMRSHQDLATIVHCGQELQGIQDMKTALVKIREGLSEIGLEASVTFCENEEEVAQVQSLASEPESHFRVEGTSARLFFYESGFAGHIDVVPADDSAFDRERHGDLLHLFANQLNAFLQRLAGVQERERLLDGYKSILDKLEEIIKAADVASKTQHVRHEIEAGTEDIFNLLDRIREKIPEDAVKWLDEIELRLQFSDRVAQQINALAAILRDLLNVMNPDAVSGDMDNQSQQASQSVLKESDEAKKDADDLLASLGL